MSKKNYSVAITTFHKRFDLFQIIIDEIKSQRPDIEIIVTVNGEYNREFPVEYRKNMLSYISKYDNIFPIFFPKFRSLTKLWNTCIQFSSNETILVIEDDITIFPGFFDDYEKVIENNDDCFMINAGYAAFNANRIKVDQANWFEERYLGLGCEDGHFSLAYTLTQYGSANMNAMPRIQIDTLKNDYTLEQIGRVEERLEGQKKTGLIWDNRYNEFNRLIDDKLRSEISDPFPKIKQYPFESFYWENKNNL
jgi:hypothetical protein